MDPRGPAPELLPLGAAVLVVVILCARPKSVWNGRVVCVYDCRPHQHSGRAAYFDNTGLVPGLYELHGRLGTYTPRGSTARRSDYVGPRGSRIYRCRVTSFRRVDAG